MTKDEILKLLGENGDLPPLPEILLKLQNLINDPDCDLEAIAELIETEPVLSGRLIKLANSVLFGGGREDAGDLSHAVMRLGIKMILDLAYTLQLPNMFNKLKSFDQYRFWRHSLAVACLAQVLSKKAGLTEEEQGESYVCGLMHDLGIVVFDYLIPDSYPDFVKSIATEETSLETLEREKFGIDHQELGGRFIRKYWSLSSTVIKSVKNHHQPLSLNGVKPTLLQLVCIANQMVCNRGITHGVGAQAEVALEDKVYENLGISPEELEEIFVETLEGLDAAEAVMKG
jgi:HD-like signal output (HDOD) protein